MSKAIKSVVGFDLGEFSFKAALLQRRNDGRIALANYASRVVAEDCESPEALAHHLKLLFNGVGGSTNDPDSRIWPTKVHRGKQPYDKVNKNLLIPRLFGQEGTGAYWAEYDWEKAASSGMQYAGLTYSGEMDFVDTSYVFPITHMVRAETST